MRTIFIFLLSVFLLSSCTLFKKTTGPSKKGDKKEDKEDDPFKPWEKTLKDARKIEGFFTLHLKEDRTLYAELAPEQLGQDFGLVMHISKGVGVLNLHDGLRLSDTRMMRFRRVGHKVQLIHRNTRFRADPGPMRHSMNENIGHSIVHAFDIESKNDSTGNLLIKLSDFLVSDYANIGEGVKYYFGMKPATYQKDKSYIDSVMAFEENVEIDAALTYQASESPIFGGGAIPDYRSIPVGIRYSLFELPENPMQPRLADDRVGYFVNAIKDFSRDKQSDPYIRYVQRWRLAPSDTAAFRRGELVEPEEPIVFYVDHSVPEEYRPYVKQGIEGWNKAFREAGFKNAVKAKIAPDDTTWSPEDIRYSTVQWTAAHRMGYAIGPSQTDPRTGEILNADILISSEFVRGWVQTYENLIPEAGQESGLPMPGRMHQTPEMLRKMFSPEVARRACLAEKGKAHQIGVQQALLTARGTLEPGAPLPDDYLGDAIRDLVLHEVGHTLGLRHNFKASSGIKTELLHDEEYTEEHGVSLSVMDYVPVNVALEKEEQGHYWNPAVGTYDEWAIQYGYMPIAEQSEDEPLTREGPLADTTADEQAGLAKIAAESSDSLHTYGTDEDGQLGPYSVDPLTNTGDLGSNPLEFGDTRTELVRKVMPLLDDRLIADGERYHRLREATSSLLYERFRSLLPVAKTVGGLYVARDHKGTPGARMPFRPVSVEKQREAVDILVDNLFAADAFDFDPERLNKLAPDRHYHWGTSLTLQIDYPVHEFVAMGQSMIIDNLLHPARLQRMIDNRARVETGSAYGPGDLMKRLTDAVWSELDDGSHINSFRRNLQRIHTNKMIDFVLGAQSWITISFVGGDQLEVPEDVRSLARLELSELSRKIGRMLSRRQSFEREISAHLSETKTRIDRALDASVELEP